MFNTANFLRSKILYFAWITAIVATVGSLYYSEVKQYIPCNLCWYQRILLFPLVIIIAVGILRRDKGIYHYVLPLSLLGCLVAFYQVLLQMGIVPETLTPCSIGAACTTKYTSYFGFISIPIMSLTAFSVISVCMLIFRRVSQETPLGKRKGKNE